MRKLIYFAFVLLGTPLLAQNWSGIISPSRAIDWSQAGVIGGIPDAAWTQCGSTVAAYGTSGSPGSPVTINSAIAACGSNQYVLLGAGTFYLNAAITFASKSNVVLRGMGADQTKISFTAGPGTTPCQGLGGGICIWNGDAQDARDGLPNTSSWSSGYSIGTTSITLANTTNLQVGDLMLLWQADQATDPGTIWNCQNTGALGDCSQQGGQSGPSGNSQMQLVTVTSIPGGGAGGAVGITPGLYSPIWAGTFTPTAGWPTHLPVLNDGVENLTLDATLTTDGPGGTLIFFGWAKNCWVTGIRTVNTGTPSYRNSIWAYQSSHLTLQSNYIFGSNGSSTSYGIEAAYGASDNLVANNIFEHTASAEMILGGVGNVFAYNYSVDNYYTAGGSAPNFQQSDSYPSHQDGSYFNLFEGNVGAKIAADDIHGTSWMSTGFRNYWTGRDGPFKTASTMVGDIEAYARYFNLIGNVLGESGYHTTYKDIPSSNVDNTGCTTTGNLSIYALGWAGGQGCNFNIVYNDTNVASTFYPWGNYDVVTAAVRWCGNSGDPGWSMTCSSTSEVPTGLSLYAQTVPANTTLPASFYYSAKPLWYVDGLGHTNLKYPAIGPDVTGIGPGGFTNIIPAQACFNNSGGDSNYYSFQGISGIAESGANATITLSGSAPAAFTQYQAFWISGSTVPGYNRLWQVATVSGSTITFTAYAGLGSESSGQVFTNLVKSFNANNCYGTAPILGGPGRNRSL
jgi:hypothetical protein